MPLRFLAAQQRDARPRGIRYDPLILSEAPVTVKTLRRQGQTVELIPASNNYKKMTVDLAQRDFRYEGEVIGVLRILRLEGGDNVS